MPKATAPTSRRRLSSDRPKTEPRLSRTRPPAELPVEEWQLRLRRQFGREQNFELENVGAEPV
jgi:hypothetical protein